MYRDERTNTMNLYDPILKSRHVIHLTRIFRDGKICLVEIKGTDNGLTFMRQYPGPGSPV